MLPSKTLADSKTFEPRLVRVPGSWFDMGSSAGQDVEQPVHRVWVDAFWLAATQTTVAQYGNFLAATGQPAPPYWNHPDFSQMEQPVVAVSWWEAVAYADWLSKLAGRLYRLPTEAEWELAARGGLEGTQFPWGDEPPMSRPAYRERWKTGPEPVQQSQPNGYGLHEMCENVHEWCSDWFQPDYYSVTPERNPKGPPEGSRKASRGGSWRHHIKISRCSARSSIPPAFQYADYGFRLVSQESSLGS